MMNHLRVGKGEQGPERGGKLVVRMRCELFGLSLSGAAAAAMRVVPELDNLTASWSGSGFCGLARQWVGGLDFRITWSFVRIVPRSA